MLLREYAERLLKLRGEAASALEELRSLERGRLHLAANEYTCLYLLPVLDEFRRLCPHISVLVQRALASRIPEQILDRTVEIGIVTFRPADRAASRDRRLYRFGRLHRESAPSAGAREAGGASATWGQKTSSPIMWFRRCGGA